MAYRLLKVSDHVKIKNSYPAHQHRGRKAIVIAVDDVDTDLVRVQIVPWASVDNERTTCVTLHSDHLMVRHEPNGFINDGRFDESKHEAHQRYLEGIRLASEGLKPVYHDYTACEFDDYDRDDLIDMIVKLRNDVSTLSDSVSTLEDQIEQLEAEIAGEDH